MWWMPSRAMGRIILRERCLSVQRVARLVAYTTSTEQDATPIPLIPSLRTQGTTRPMATRVQSTSAARAPVAEAGAQQLDERELRAWRGMLRIHATLTKALDAELEAAHGLPL